MSIKEKLVTRFLNYVAVPSQSDFKGVQVPSTPGQIDMAKLLEKELTELNLSEIKRDEYGIVTALLPGNCVDAPKIGFVAHTDTVDVALSDTVHPQRIHFDGNDILLNQEQDIWLRTAEHPEIMPYVGDEIIVTDGTSVLGADNKAAIAIVMTMLEQIQLEDRPRGDIYVAFVPDEEIGLKGAKLLDLEQFKPDFAYTIDCCEMGEVVYETFNAGDAILKITGVSAHPMSAKGVLVNPIRVATDFMNCFDAKDTPEYTDGKEGYFWFNDITGNQSQVILKMNIRDFDLQKYQARKRYIEDTAAFIQAKHPRAKIECTLSDTYSNIANHLGSDRRSIELIYEAFKKLNIEPKTKAMRGGTDGSALSAKGLTTPNYFTGAHNFHSCFEFLPLKSFEASYEVTMMILQMAGQMKR